jgi:hypothetical protein
MFVMKMLLDQEAMQGTCMRFLMRSRRQSVHVLDMPEQDPTIGFLCHLILAE